MLNDFIPFPNDRNVDMNVFSQTTITIRNIVSSAKSIRYLGYVHCTFAHTYQYMNASNKNNRIQMNKIQNSSALHKVQINYTHTQTHKVNAFQIRFSIH